jgi:hypothetical protein
LLKEPAARTNTAMWTLALGFGTAGSAPLLDIEGGVRQCNESGMSGTDGAES